MSMTREERNRLKTLEEKAKAKFFEFADFDPKVYLDGSDATEYQELFNKFIVSPLPENTHITFKFVWNDTLKPFAWTPEEINKTLDFFPNAFITNHNEEDKTIDIQSFIYFVAKDVQGAKKHVRRIIMEQRKVKVFCVYQVNDETSEAVFTEEDCN